MHQESSYSPLALDHARNPRHMAPLSEFDGYASLTGPCGDTMDFWIRVVDGVATEVGFTTDGCGSSRAAGSMTCTLARGRHLAALGLIGQRDVLEALGDFPSESEHCALLATETLHAAVRECFQTMRVRRIDRKYLVLGGKGGVGKSTIAANLALLLRDRGLRTGLLDADIHGPSVPAMTGTESVEPERSDDALRPAEIHGIRAVSIGMFLPQPDQALAWRGPRKSNIVRQFLREVDWGDLDVLVIDAPPGTGDELLTIARSAGPLDGAIVVTTPQRIAAIDVRRAVTFCRDMGIPVLGILVNMAGLVCPHCGETTRLFPDGPGLAIASDMGIPFLGSLPFDPELSMASDTGSPLVASAPESETAQRLRDLLEPILSHAMTGIPMAKAEADHSR